VFVDAKGISSNLDGLVTSNLEIIWGRTKTSVIKAIQQANETLDTLLNSENQSIIDKDGNNVLLVVTYDELMLGDGVVFSSLLENTEHNLLSTGIELDSIFFLDVGEFQTLCECVGRGETTFQAVLDYAKNDGCCIRTQKLGFYQSFIDLGIGSQESEIKGLMSEIVKSMENSIGIKLPESDRHQLLGEAVN